MTNDPTDAVHLSEVARAVFLGHAVESAQPFGTCEAELVNKRVGHADFSFAYLFF
jgi:hypothetical protein